MRTIIIMNIKYEREIRYAELLTPLKGYELERQIVEHRFDPLTHKRTVITTGRFHLIKRLFESDPNEIQNIVEMTKSNCPFCPERLESMTPKFPSNLFKEGVIKLGDATLFPSLFSHMDYNAIVVLGKEHYLQLREIAPNKIHSAFQVGQTFLRKLYDLNRKKIYASFIVNYFPLSGSTIIHPHMQVIASDMSFQLLDELLSNSFVYYSRVKSNYWADLIKEEESSERFVGKVDEVTWFTPFAPYNTYEVWGVHEKVSNLLEISDQGLKGFSQGLSKVLSFYQEEGLSCFNILLYSGPLGESSDRYFRLGIRIIGRSGYRKPFVSDLWGLQSVMNEGEAYDTPENTALKLRKYFQ
ncbi:MAG: hypothetical protein QXJ17_07310 [Nitrososphaeria archaeon]